MADAIIVGAGVVGAAVADALSEAGLRVTLLDATLPGGGTTAAGMGHIVVMDDSEAQFQLTSYSRTLLDALRPELTGSAEYERTGTLWVAEDAEQLQIVREKHAYYSQRGVAVEILDAQALAEAEPNLRPLAGALRVPDDGVLYPPGLARVLLDRALKRGCALRTGVRVERLEAHTVVTQDQRLQADIVVNAAGAAASLLTPELPIVPRKGHLVITDRYPNFCRHQLVELGYLKSAHTMDAASVAFNLQPRRTGQVLIGSSRELVGWDASINRSIVRRMLQRALQFTPKLAALSAIRTWTGFRPTTPDKLPLIGPWEPQEGVWIAAGHEGLGITTALGTARLLADMIVGRVPVLDAGAYSPVRALVAEAA
ncbi:MAG: NAD(P)/FAD-dependent oxidoreductase [Longimicrobiales bacterium]